VGEHLLSKCEALSSNPRAVKKKKNKTDKKPHRIPGPYSRPPESELHFNKIPQNRVIVDCVEVNTQKTLPGDIYQMSNSWYSINKRTSKMMKMVQKKI
jgi:hypothetical protein